MAQARSRSISCSPTRMATMAEVSRITPRPARDAFRFSCQGTRQRPWTAKTAPRASFPALRAPFPGLRRSFPALRGFVSGLHAAFPAPREPFPAHRGRNGPETPHSLRLASRRSRGTVRSPDPTPPGRQGTKMQSKLTSCKYHGTIHSLRGTPRERWGMAHSSPFSSRSLGGMSHSLWGKQYEDPDGQSCRTLQTGPNSAGISAGTA